MPVLDLKSFEFISRSADQTRRVGMRLGTMLEAGDVVGLVGDLGSGKTTLVQGISSGWGSLDPASSPTFVLVNEYMGRLPVYHIDLYRLSTVTEEFEIGILDYLAKIDSGVIVVEWAEKVISLLPDDYLAVHFQMLSPRQRRLTLTGFGKRYDGLLKELGG